MSFLRSFALLLSLLLSAPALAGPAALPDGAAWLRHVNRDLLPWWTQPAAQGNPVGRFPTFRCHDGAAWNPAAPCPELEKSPAWIRSELGRDYVRMQARQVYTYAMGFHLTGDPRLLQLAAAGVRDIRSRALDPATGSPATYWQDGRAEPAVELRTAQDVAYAGAALGVWYYLTRDPETLADLDRLHQHLMRYYDPASGRMKWTLGGPQADPAELVAQLDPLNAYMLLVTPILPQPLHDRWLADMRRLTGAIRTQFCAQQEPRCQGTLGTAEAALPGARHNDFGHSGKAFWMSWLAAEQTGDTELATWAQDKGRALLREAYVARNGSWARRWTTLGIQAGNDWWIHAELDQLAATLAQRERGQAAYLQHTQPFWFRYFVEPGMPEVWSSVAPDGSHDPDDLRQHHWKNGYHAMEHALVGYITAQALAGKPVRLHFAADAAGAPLHAYFFGGKPVRSKVTTRNGTAILAVDFVLPAPAASPDPLASLPAAVTALPGSEVKLDAANTAELLLGEWEGIWLDEPSGAEGRLTLRYERFDGKLLSGHYSASGTGADERSTDVAFESLTRFVDGRMQGGSDSGGVYAVTHTLRREGDQYFLDWRDRVNGHDLLMWVRKRAR